MATKYIVPETAATEEAGPFWVKADAVNCADASAAEHPGVTFTVTTGKGTTVHTVLVEAQDETPAESVTPAMEIPAEDAPQADEEADSDADNTPAEIPADEDKAAGQGVAEQDIPQDSAPAAQGAFTAELCATNTWANIVHIRPLGDQRTVCGSASTSRRANARQVAEIKRCKFCLQAAEEQGLVIDERPAGSGQRATGSRRRPKTLVVDAGEIRDLVAHLKNGEAYAMELTDGTRIEVRAGDPVSGELDDESADIRSLSIVSS